MQKIHKSPKTVEVFCDDKDKGLKIGLNKDSPKNYIGGHLVFDHFKTCNFGDKKYGSMFFGNSGI